MNKSFLETQSKYYPNNAFRLTLNILLLSLSSLIETVAEKGLNLGVDETRIFFSVRIFFSSSSLSEEDDDSFIL